MKREVFIALIETEVEEILEINRTKGRDYAGEEDALRNFKEASARLGVPPETVWAVYADKHWQAILTYCTQADLGEYEASEPIEGRIRDLILYGFLLLGLVDDRDRAVRASTPPPDVEGGTPPSAAEESVPGRGLADPREAGE